MRREQVVHHEGETADAPRRRRVPPAERPLDDLCRVDELDVGDDAPTAAEVVAEPLGETLLEPGPHAVARHRDDLGRERIRERAREDRGEFVDQRVERGGDAETECHGDDGSEGLRAGCPCPAEPVRRSRALAPQVSADVPHDDAPLVAVEVHVDAVVVDPATVPDVGEGVDRPSLPHHGVVVEVLVLGGVRHTRGEVETDVAAREGEGGVGDVARHPLRCDGRRGSRGR